MLICIIGVPQLAISPRVTMNVDNKGDNRQQHGK